MFGLRKWIKLLLLLLIAGCGSAADDWALEDLVQASGDKTVEAVSVQGGTLEEVSEELGVDAEMMNALNADAFNDGYVGPLAVVVIPSPIFLPYQMSTSSSTTWSQGLQYENYGDYMTVIPLGQVVFLINDELFHGTFKEIAFPEMNFLGVEEACWKSYNGSPFKPQVWDVSACTPHQYVVECDKNGECQ